MKNKDFEEQKRIIVELTGNFTQIIPKEKLTGLKYGLDWHGNGVGNRWANSKYNYTVIYNNGETKSYSSNISDQIDRTLLDIFITKSAHKGPKSIIGLFVHSVRKIILRHKVSAKIRDKIIVKPCVNCGTCAEIICDHKNDLYNDPRVSDTKTQVIDDFQPLCTHCNLQKRAAAKKEKETQHYFSAKNLPWYDDKMYPFSFPWEKYTYSTDYYPKQDSYWYDPIEFQRKVDIYATYVRPQLRELKQRFKSRQ
jgi:hypothetical protein